MARWQVTISHPSSLIPALVLECFNEDGYSRIDPSMFSAGERSIADSLTLDKVPNKYIWSFSVDLVESDLSRLGAFFNWQDLTYSANGNGALTLTDEVRYLDPEPSPHSRTLLASIAESYGTFVKGFGVFPVKLIRQGESPEILGQDGTTNGPRYRVKFSAVEL